MEVGIDRLDPGVVAVPEGDPVVEVEDGPLKALDEGVDVRAAGRDPVRVASGSFTFFAVSGFTVGCKA